MPLRSDFYEEKYDLGCQVLEYVDDYLQKGEPTETLSPKIERLQDNISAVDAEDSDPVASTRLSAAVNDVNYQMKMLALKEEYSRVVEDDERKANVADLQKARGKLAGVLKK